MDVWPGVDCLVRQRPCQAVSSAIVREGGGGGLARGLDPANFFVTGRCLIGAGLLRIFCRPLPPTTLPQLFSVLYPAPSGD